MRLKSHIWVKAYLRRCAGEGVPAVVVRHGDDDAGAIFIKIDHLNGACRVYGPAPSGLDVDMGERRWSPRLGGADAASAVADAFLRREADFDSDLWVIEVEERTGRHFLDGWLEPDA